MRLVTILRQKAENTPFYILFAGFAVFCLQVLLAWRRIDTAFHRQASYYEKGITLEFKITSTVELQRVRSGGQPFILHECLGRLSRGDVYYDIGANIGIHTLPAAVMVGQTGLVVAFEPDSANYHRLLENADQNNINNLVAFCVALGSTNGISPFYRPTNRIGEGGAHLYQGDTEPSSVTKVHQIRLDDLIPLWGLPVPQLVKIDVERSELDVLYGMRKILSDNRLQAVVCEVTVPWTRYPIVTDTASAVSALLTTHGFKEVSRQSSGSAAPIEDILFIKSK